ncbi:hypothetical protein [Vibrio coralliilyticus]|uniref:Uncharacterized protein n=1 Tax=Vibrio coralliilyticus TaxID=190893 RepID=A0AAP6ZNL9_9VIBR|nr:hypothetical protein [Vibrio coralliilyticus]NOI31806.1 hypothetical protein [Vibrio coralliilyticus]NOJ25249.1 hypothetical protein [Vibrio coralliilyticus]
MPKFSLNGFVTVSASTTIEADTLEEAIKKAENLPVMHSTQAHGAESDVWVVEDMDGYAQEIYADED